MCNIINFIYLFNVIFITITVYNAKQYLTSMKCKKVILLLLDSFGIGAAPDANKFNDVGSDTLGHIVEYFHQKNYHFSLPNLAKRGLQLSAESSRGKKFPISLFGKEKALIRNAHYGYCSEISSGKDTPSGHWEIAGVPVLFDWHYFSYDGIRSSVFPDDFIQSWIKAANIGHYINAGIGSGTDILDKYGLQHCETGGVIIYTSADSVFQVAAHEDIVPLDKLYGICQTARHVFDELGLRVGRVIARPFIGNNAEGYVRTGNRRDFSVFPPKKNTARPFESIQKNKSFLLVRSLTFMHTKVLRKNIKANGIEGLFNATLLAYQSAQSDALIFTNFVDFDSLYGHRRDIKGYGDALMYLDSRLPELDAILDDDTIIIVAADHGCDPSWVGSDHTREFIPFLLWGNKIQNKDINYRNTFADIGQTIADYFNINPLEYGKSALARTNTVGTQDEFL